MAAAPNSEQGEGGGQSGTAAIGSSEWFVTLRHRCIDHHRALASLYAADRYLSKLRERPDREIAAALHSAAVTAYAQAFTEARTARGAVTYKTRSLRRVSGFDGRLHEHLMQLRNRFIAHADYGPLPGAMDFQKIGDLRVAINVRVKRLEGIASPPLLERYLSHVRACKAAVETMLNRELQELAQAAERSPEAFEASHNVPAFGTPLAATGQFEDLPDGLTVPDAEFDSGLAGYDYVTLSHCLPLIQSGRYTTRDEDGNSVEIDFEVTGGQGQQA